MRRPIKYVRLYHNTTMDSEPDKASRQPDELLVTLDPKNPVLWKQVVEEKIWPYLRGRSARPMFGPGSLSIPGKRQTSRNRKSLSPTPPDSERGSTFPILSLPWELFCMVMDHAMEPHDVYMSIRTNKFEGKRIFDPVFKESIKPDTRKLLVFFHVSKAFQVMAISRYGDCNPDSPEPMFNPRLDKVVLLSTEPLPLESYSPPNPFMDFLRCVRRFGIGIQSDCSFDETTRLLPFLSAATPSLRSLEVAVTKYIKENRPVRNQRNQRFLQALGRVESGDTLGTPNSSRIFPRLEFLRLHKVDLGE
ncbi:hypothetical protein GGR53DRAFT_133104 [Hypoxylon sp. FL1150]|nr:hypothetical protein GGR53DRAFT_133104 [Hypoxylon sp. FL1150]